MCLDIYYIQTIADLHSGCIASFIRLQSLLTFHTTLDPTWDYVPVTVWTEIEIVCGHVCLSLPAIRVLSGRVFHTNILASLNRSRNTNDPITPQDSKPKPMPRATPTKVNKKRQTMRMRLSAAAYRDNSGTAAKDSWPTGWSPRPWSGPQRTPTRGHRRLGSDQASVCDFSHVRTCTPPVLHEHKAAPLGCDVEMGVVSEAPPEANMCLSCESENSYLTALPTLGCLPDNNFSSTDLSRRRDGIIV